MNTNDPSNWAFWDSIQSAESYLHSLLGEAQLRKCGIGYYFPGTRNNYIAKVRERLMQARISRACSPLLPR